MVMFFSWDYKDLHNVCLIRHCVEVGLCGGVTKIQHFLPQKMASCRLLAFALESGSWSAKAFHLSTRNQNAATQNTYGHYISACNFLIQVNGGGNFKHLSFVTEAFNLIVMLSYSLTYWSSPANASLAEVVTVCTEQHVGTHTSVCQLCVMSRLCQKKIGQN